MAVMTFSRTFPVWHPKAGQPTNFVPKIWNSLFYGQLKDSGWLPDGANEDCPNEDFKNFYHYTQSINDEKHHTIRANRKDGKLWMAGDWFTPKIWGTNVNPKNGRSGPYQSKQIPIAPMIEIKKVWDFEISEKDIYIGGNLVFREDSEFIESSNVVKELAENDGLSAQDLLAWFKYPKPFKGQIICWNDSINY